MSYKHHTPRCSIAVDTNTGSSGGIIQKTLASGSNTVNVIVTAEDGTTTKTYTVTVTRQIPQTDSSLKSLGITCTPQPSKVPPSYQTDANSSISACWLSKTASGGDPSVTGYDSAFDPTHLTYYVRAQHNAQPLAGAAATCGRVSARLVQLRQAPGAGGSAPPKGCPGTIARMSRSLSM